MPQTAHLDPLGPDLLDIFMTERRADRAPVPLIGVEHAIALEGGLAMVTTTRHYRNAEAASIEAVLTFPVPVHAVVHGLEVQIEGRTLRATARARAAARDDYEKAIDDGRTAVLHEEVLRGLHMISLGQLGPGRDIRVTTHWVASLAVSGGRATLRIPQTIGQIYGTSPLLDAEDVVLGGVPLRAVLRVRGTDVRIAGVSLDEAGQGMIGTDRAIDLETPPWPARILTGRTAEGHAVEVKLAPEPPVPGVLDCAVLVDRSGSMDGAKLAGARRALQRMAARLRDGDRLSLWQFNGVAEHLGIARDPAAATALVSRLGEAAGGTEIGRALHEAIAQGGARDILVLTDGRSHALDVQALARGGTRIGVVLIGTDALEARIGHLAALTGGDIFIAAYDPDAATEAALAALRRHGGRDRHAGTMTEASRAGVRIETAWRDGPAATGDTARAVGAFAAALVLPHLDAEAATDLAQREGLVTHLTSLVLVDEAGAVQETLPVQRRVALAEVSPTLGAFDASGLDALRCAETPMFTAPQDIRQRRRSGRSDNTFRETSAPRFNFITPSPPRVIDWNGDGERLLQGDLALLDPDMRRRVEALAARPEVVALANHLRLVPVVLVLALLARQAETKNGDRVAGRIARRVLAGADRTQVNTLAAQLGL